jgi:valyl-tRNA synthetase
MFKEVTGASEGFIPMGMRPQAHDIIRTWAFYTIIKSWMHEKKIPWKDIVISGHVLSSESEKISKSRGNAPLDPVNLLKTYPADVIRYWTASGTLGYDIAFSDTKLKIGQKLMVKLWNAALFAREHVQNLDMSSYGSIHSSHSSEHSPRADTIQPLALSDSAGIVSKGASGGAVNEWILHRASETFALYQKYFDGYEFGLALQAAEQFFWHDLCDNYLELIKDQLFRPEKYSAHEVAATKATLYHVVLRVLQLFAPYMPHVTETIYQDMFKKYVGSESLHLTRFENIQKHYAYAPRAQQVEHLLAVVAQVRKLKSDHEVSLKTELAELLVVAHQDVIDALKPLEQVLKGVTNAQVVAYATQTAGTSFLQERDGVWYTTICLM